MSSEDKKVSYVGDILLVENTTASLKYLVSILISAGYHVRPASDGELALRSIEIKLPDLILLDIIMPGINGIEVCRQLKKNPETSNIPIIFISSIGESELKAKALEAGGADYITEPFNQSEILARIKSHLYHYRLQQKLTRQTQELQSEIEDYQNVENELKISELRYRRLYENTPFGMILCKILRDESGKTIDVELLRGNAAASDQTGLDMRNIAGKKASEFCQQEQLLELLSLYKPVSASETPLSYIHYFDVFKRILDLTVFRLFEDIYVLNFNDVTKQKQTEKEVADGARKWQTTFDAISNPVCILNMKGYIIQYNAATKIMFNINEEEIEQKHCWQLIHNREEPLDDCPLIRMKTTKRKEKSTFLIGNRWLEASVDPIFNDDGQIEEAVYIIRDITEYKQALDDLGKHRDHLEELVQKRTQKLEIQKEELQALNLVFIDREFRIKELRDEIKVLKDKKE